jgi:hypothetical protein
MKKIATIKNKLEAFIDNRKFSEAINYLQNNEKEIFNKKNLRYHGQEVLNIMHNTMTCHLQQSGNHIDNLYNAISLYHDHFNSLQKIAIDNNNDDNFKAFQTLTFFNSELEGDFHQSVVQKAQFCINEGASKQQNLETLDYLNKSISLATESTAKREIKIVDLKKLKNDVRKNLEMPRNSNQLFFPIPSTSETNKRKQTLPDQSLTDQSLPIKKRKIATADEVGAVTQYNDSQSWLPKFR